ncbi:MAG: type I polyketide synthase, partial [Thermoanaerobaculia bacterium]
MDDERRAPAFDGSEVAVVGMACRLPGANTVDEFWEVLRRGDETLTRLRDEELARSGVPREVREHPGYVRRASVLDDVESFDAGFFGYTPMEARLMDPQHRLFLECAWEAFEHAGYDPAAVDDPVGVFTGAKTNTYLLGLFSNRELFDSLDPFQVALGNDLASMATRVSYKLNLRGPSYALHTACSTSLVAVHLACQSLVLGECEMALAGGAAINVPQKKGYLYQQGGILSPDGSSRTFDAEAGGSNFGNGVGAVLLKRAEDAVADGDHIYAVIRGSATNNDGAKKASFTAPGVEGQTAVLIEALACSGVDADTISYVEAHGTATDLGDSIEMLALKNAFGASTEKSGFCALGSVKTNLGHLETAAGVAGLIKTALALDRGELPPSLHFERPNPKLEIEGSPFYVNTELREWKRGPTPRRAGVSSFGIGSTNAHAILEEAPPAAESSASRPWQLLPVSARSEAALDAATGRLAEHLERRSRELDGEAAHRELADTAYTLQVGRRGFAERRAVVCTDLADAVAALEGQAPERVVTRRSPGPERPVAFLFPGLGDHYVEMGLGLYRDEPVFRAELDRCAEILEPHLECDLREVLYPRGTDVQEAVSTGEPDLRRMLGRGGGRDDDPEIAEAARRLNRTSLTQPAVFAVEWALARLWIHWGVRPRAMVGYSLGELVAAALAGVFSLEDALALVARRARLIEELPAGAMLAVPLSEADLAPRLEAHGLSLAAVNGPTMTVAAGRPDAVDALEAELSDEDVVCRRLQTSHAFHSTMLDPVADELTALVESVELSPPGIPY